ncbi:MAG: DUF5686 family protein [Tannerellaceae bacterium]
MKLYTNKLLLFLLFVVTLTINNVQAQSTTKVTGIIKDSITGETVPYVAVVFDKSTIGTMSLDNGSFSLQNTKGLTNITVSSLGYEDYHFTVPVGKTTNKIIQLRPSTIEIAEVIVKPKKEKYTKKNNPAVELIEEVIRRKDQNRIEAKDQYYVEKYEKLSLALDNFQPNLDKNKLLRKFKFVFNHLDTSEISGKPILTFSIRENLSDIYFRKDPKAHKTFVKAKRLQGVEETIDEGGITSNLEEILKSVNLFNDDVSILLNRFVSPLSSKLATNYYKYYIMDTVMVGNDKCVDLGFVPFNSESYGFTGRLYITTDGHYSIKKVKLNVPKSINLNFVEDFQVVQDFKMLEDSTWVIDKEQTSINFSVVKGTQAMYANQLRTYNNYDFALQPDSIYSTMGNILVMEDAEAKPDTFWVHNRHVPLGEKEGALKDLLAQFKRVPVFNAVIKTVEILVSGYIQTGKDRSTSKFDFGPMNTTISGNEIEGLRLRVGGTTTANLHDQLFASGYLAYGLDDRKFKYNGKLTWSFNKLKYHENEFPKNKLSAQYEYDLYTPGQSFLFTSKDNIFVALKTGKPVTKMSYIRKAVLTYERDWRNNFGLKAWVCNQEDTPAGTLRYIKENPDGTTYLVNKVTNTDMGFQLRYAPNEKPYAGRNPVFNFAKDAPIFKLTHQMGYKGFLGSDYNYQHTELSAEKRIWLSSFGHIDAIAKAGKVWTSVPFPLLILPNANQSLTIQPESFHVMNALEFVADQYTSLDVTYYMKGWLLNRIPGIRWFKLREVISFNGIWGGLTKKNNPYYNKDMFLLPEGTRPLGDMPYMEASVGLENIFKVLRVDYYRRLTYLDDPDTRKWGIRILLRFSF